MKLLSVPLFELYDNTMRYGPQLSAIPHYLSRYRFEFVDEDGQVMGCMPGVAQENGSKEMAVEEVEGKHDEVMMENGG